MIMMMMTRVPMWRGREDEGWERAKIDNERSSCGERRCVRDDKNGELREQSRGLNVERNDR